MKLLEEAGSPRTREDGHHIAILRPVVTFHDQLMCPCHQRQTIVVVECLRDILPECIPRSARRDSPAAPVVGIRPQEIAHGSLMGHFLYPIQGSDVVEGVNAGRQAAMKAEDLVVNKRGEREVVEKVGKIFPYICIAVFPEALVVKPIYLGNLSGLMVSSKDGDALGVSNFEGNKESDSLDGEIAAINIVTCVQSASGVSNF